MDNFPWTTLFEDLLDDDQKVEDDHELPKTGLPLEFERIQSSIRVELSDLPVSICRISLFLLSHLRSGRTQAENKLLS